MKFIDFRSDTVTQPTQAMREAMYHAEVGDDVYGDDPTVRKLEALAARLAGKEAALFVPSGTFGNQLALLTHCARGNEVILGDDCHIVAHEAGASAVIAGVQLRTLRTVGGAMDPEEVVSKIRETDIHHPSTGLICMENAYSNGMVIPLSNMADIYGKAKQHRIPVHLDGARLFNAACHLGVDAAEITCNCDSVMFCLSKGLCAPVGSILAGSKEFIGKALFGRKLMGGGLRQAGILAAAGLVALEEMCRQLPSDHENARLLGQELAKLPEIHIHQEAIHINMVFFRIVKPGFSYDVLSERLLAQGIKINPPMDGMLRLVTHHWITKEDILFTVEQIRNILTART